MPGFTANALLGVSAAFSQSCPLPLALTVGRVPFPAIVATVPAAGEKARTTRSAASPNSSSPSSVAASPAGVAKQTEVAGSAPPPAVASVAQLAAPVPATVLMMPEELLTKRSLLKPTSKINTPVPLIARPRG